MIEPPRLLSRLMAFVLAGSLAIFIVLVAALERMFPLEKTQIFFLSSKLEPDQVVAIQRMDLNPNSLEAYKISFIKDYMIKRNSVYPSNTAMRRIWYAGASSPLYAYSDEEVFRAMTKTDLYYAVMEGKWEPLIFNCGVTFAKQPELHTRATGTYSVRISYQCKDDSSGQTQSKPFTILVSVKVMDSVRWNERLDNPLGLKVVGYEVMDGDPDPLDVSQWIK